MSFGADHPETLHCMGELALTYQRQRRSKAVEELQSEVMETQKVKLGVNHPDTLTYW